MCQDLVDESMLTEVPPGFTISMYEFQATIPSLWETVKRTSELRRNAFYWM